MKKVWGICFAIFLLGTAGFVWLFNVNLIYAKESETVECVPLDVIFLIDQSTDMTELDPENARISVTEWMIGFLGYDYLTLCPEEAHRVAVVSYGTEKEKDFTQYPSVFPSVVTEDISFEPLNPESLEGAEGWIEWRNQLANVVQSKDMYGRDFIGALKKAGEMFQDNYSGRKQVLIMFAGNGGIPCYSSYDYNTCSQTYYTNGITSGFFKDLQVTLDTDFEFDEENGPYIHVYTIVEQDGDVNFDDVPNAITESNYTAKIAGPWQTVLEQYQGKFEPVDNSTELAESVMNDLLIVSPHPDIQQINVGDHYLDPMMAESYIFGYRANPNQSVEIKWEDHDHKPAIVDAIGDREIFGVQDPQEGATPSNAVFYAFSAPPAGEWKINGSNIVLWAFSLPAEEISVQTPTDTLGQYDEPGYIADPEFPNFFSFLVVGEPGKSYLKEYSGYPAIIDAEVEMPDGTSYPLTFSLDETNKVFTSNEPLPVSLVGEYNWRVDLDIDSASPKSDETFSLIQATGTYTVNPVTPFTYSITDPLDEKLPLHKGPSTQDLMQFRDVDTVDVGVYLTDTEGNPLELSTVFNSDIDDSVKLIVTDVTKDHSEEYTLTSVNYDDTYLTATIPSEDFDSEGDYKLEIDTYGVPNTQLYRESPQEVSRVILRKDNLGTDPGFYWTIIYTFFILLFAGIGFFIYQHTNPVKGTLYFFRPNGTTPFDEIDLRSASLLGRRSITLNHNKLLNKVSLLMTNFIDQMTIISGSNEDVKVKIKSMDGAQTEEDLLTRDYFDGDIQPIDNGIYVQYSRSNEFTGHRAPGNSSSTENEPTSFSAPAAEFSE